MVGIQEPLPVSRVINCIVPAGKNKREGLCSTVHPQRDLTVLESERAGASPPLPGLQGPGILTAARSAGPDSSGSLSQNSFPRIKQLLGPGTNLSSQHEF